MAVALLAIAAILFLRHKTSAPCFFSVGILFQLVAWIYPTILIPIEKIWMKIGHGLGWVNARIILVAMFFLILTPTRFILWLLRKNLLDEKIQKQRTSYWNIRQANINVDPNRYERLS